MSGSTPQNATRWSRKTLAAVLFPFVAAALAVNLFLASLLGAALGLPVLTPTMALVLSLPLGVPASLRAARWVERLLDEAEG